MTNSKIKRGAWMSRLPVKRPADMEDPDNMLESGYASTHQMISEIVDVFRRWNYPNEHPDDFASMMEIEAILKEAGYVTREDVE